MKILLTASKDNNFYNFRSELILKLLELNFEVVLVCPYGHKIDYFTSKGCRFIDMDIDRRGKNCVRDYRLYKFYGRLLRKEKPDLVLTYTTKCSIYCGIQCAYQKIPYIVNNAGLIDVDDKPFLKMILNILYKISFSKSACMMYQNKYEAEKLNLLLGRIDKFKLIPGSGVNLEHFSYQEYPSPSEPIIFNYVARIIRFKGIEDFLCCAKQIKKEYDNTRFIIYGDFDDDSYRTEIMSLERKGIVEYGGVKMDMRPYIKKASAVIHASYYEGMTNVVLEHSAMGRPCIGANIPGIREGIDDGKTGYLFQVRDADSLIEAVRKFIGLRYDERLAMSKAARIKMEKEFNREIVTNTYLTEIQKILEKRYKD